MSHYFRRACIVSIAFIISSLMVAWAQSTPTADPGKTTTPTQNATPEQRPSPGNISRESLRPTVIESLITPSLEGSHLGPADAMKLGESGIIDNAFTREVQRVKWRAGDPIDLYVIKPVGVKKPAVILYLYSYPFEMNRFLNSEVCKFLVRNGVAAVAFPSALTGGRYHDRPMKEWFVSEMRESLATTSHDVQLILNYLSERGDMDMDRVGMFGDGSGASIAILAAAADPRIKSLDLVDPWGDWPDWVATSTRIPEKERPNFMKKEWLDLNASMDPIKWFPQLKTPNVRLQLVKSVGITPAEAQAKIAAAAPRQAKIVRFDDVQTFKASAADGSGLDWLKEHVLGETDEQFHAASQDQGKSGQGKSPDQSQNSR